MAEVLDKRQVSTDALSTLGSILGDGEQRDAIHLAVEPALAGEKLSPGQHVRRAKDGTFFGLTHKEEGEKGLGIVDPFLSTDVKQGQRFWLIIYPRQITSLRHVWEHPDFPLPDILGAVRKVTERLTRNSETWIRDEFIPKIEDYGHDLTFEQVMAGAEDWLTDGGGVCAHNDIDYDFINSNIGLFWEHYMNVTGKNVPMEKREPFFQCSC